jgi:NAD(P)-dependent dehydrogenase (short-subunit alcohol dehydrogenase family)
VKETNGRAAFLLSQGFLKLLGKKRKGTIVNLTSALALTAMPIASSYGLSKLVVIQLQAYIAAENPNVTAVALHPGIVKTDMTHPIFEPFALDTPALIGGVGVWLSTEQVRIGRALFFLFGNVPRGTPLSPS